MTYEEEYLHKLVADEDVSGLTRPPFTASGGELFWRVSTHALETLPKKSRYSLQDPGIQVIINDFSTQQHQLLTEVKEAYVQLLFQFIKP